MLSPRAARNAAPGIALSIAAVLIAALMLGSCASSRRTAEQRTLTETERREIVRTLGETLAGERGEALRRSEQHAGSRSETWAEDSDVTLGSLHETDSTAVHRRGDSLRVVEHWHIVTDSRRRITASAARSARSAASVGSMGSASSSVASSSSSAASSASASASSAARSASVSSVRPAALSAPSGLVSRLRTAWLWLAAAAAAALALWLRMKFRK